MLAEQSIRSIRIKGFAQQLSELKAGEPGNPKRDWFDAERNFLKLIRRDVADLAFRLWQQRGSPVGDPNDDWIEAERELLWRQWAREIMLPYLAIEVKANAESLAKKLRAAHLQHGFKPENTLSMMVVLDGSPEYCFHWHRASAAGINGVPVERRAEDKDGRFVQLCLDAICSPRRGVHVLGLESAGKGNFSLVSRPYQDGLVFVITGADPLHKGIAVALELRRCLLKHNEVSNLQWTERLHARISLGHSYSDAARSLPYAYRDEIALTSHALSSLPVAEQGLLLSAGVRVSDSEASPCYSI